MHLSEEQLDVYRATRRRRDAEERGERRRRKAEAWQTARRAAEWLRQRFGASRVVLFGSVARGDRLGVCSDVDLAVWGLEPLPFLEAVADVQGCSSRCSIDLIRMERCPEALREEILSEGVEL